MTLERIAELRQWYRNGYLPFKEFPQMLDLAEAALKQPRTQITREQVERLYRLALVVSGPETFAGLLLELGINVEPPKEERT